MLGEAVLATAGGWGSAQALGTACRSLWSLWQHEVTHLSRANLWCPYSSSSKHLEGAEMCLRCVRCLCLTPMWTCSLPGDLLCGAWSPRGPSWGAPGAGMSGPQCHFTVLGGDMETPPLPSSTSAPDCSPSFGGAGLHGAMVSTRPWAAEPRLSRACSTAPLHLGNTTALFFCWSVSYRSLEETHCFDLKRKNVFKTFLGNFLKIPQNWTKAKLTRTN